MHSVHLHLEQCAIFLVLGDLIHKIINTSVVGSHPAISFLKAPFMKKLSVNLLFTCLTKRQPDTSVINSKIFLDRGPLLLKTFWINKDF